MTTETSAKKGGDVVGRLLQKMLMPIVATAASAAASYAAKKGPQLLEQKVGPKARELMNGAGDATHDLPEKAKAAAGDVVSSAGETARSVTGSNGSRRSISSRELEQRRQQRDKGRAERRKHTR